LPPSNPNLIDFVARCPSDVGRIDRRVGDVEQRCRELLEGDTTDDKQDGTRQTRVERGRIAIAARIAGDVSDIDTRARVAGHRHDPSESSENRIRGSAAHVSNVGRPDGTCRHLILQFFALHVCVIMWPPAMVVLACWMAADSPLTSRIHALGRPDHVPHALDLHEVLAELVRVLPAIPFVHVRAVDLGHVPICALRPLRAPGLEHSLPGHLQ